MQYYLRDMRVSYRLATQVQAVRELRQDDRLWVNKL